MSAGPCPDIEARLADLLSRINRVRRNAYPEGWKHDPLYGVEQELKGIYNALKNSKEKGAI